jgi:IS5 family transposase
VTRPVRREVKRRAAVEPVTSHLKAEYRMGRNYLKGRDGDRANAVLAAVGYNFALLLRCQGDFCVASSRRALSLRPLAFNIPKNRRSTVLRGRLDITTSQPRSSGSI